MARGRLGEQGLPRKGWVLDSVEDVRDGGEISVKNAIYQSCGFCNQHPVRYVHVLHHPKHSDELRVGVKCAGDLTDNYANAESAERALKERMRARNQERNAKAKRRADWVSRTWPISGKGNPWIEADDHRVVLLQSYSKWKFSLDGAYSNARFDTTDEAKGAAFDVLFA
jgi:hypothetical protein